jgi:Amino acid synthesis
LAGRKFGALQTWIEAMKIRKIYTFVEDTLSVAGKSGEPLLRRVAAVAIVENPHAGHFVEDLKPMIDASEALGHELSKIVVQALRPYRAQSYGKGGIVGLAGEQEHINALLTTTFANPLREAVGGGKAWISSMTKRGGPGTSIDIPLAHKDALYVRSHYDGMTITLHDAPLPDEIAVIICVANRGRLNARVGGIKVEEIKGEDGLR